MQDKSASAPFLWQLPFGWKRLFVSLLCWMDGRGVVGGLHLREPDEAAIHRTVVVTELQSAKVGNTIDWNGFALSVVVIRELHV